jgi:hypothetical protein
LDHFFTLEVTGYDFLAKGEAVKRCQEKGGVKGVFITIPKAGGSAAGITKRVNEEIAEFLGVVHQFGKCSGSFWVIYIPLLPKPCHNEMIFDDKGNNLTAFGGNMEAFEERTGDLHPAFAVALDAASFANIMQ